MTDYLEEHLEYADALLDQVRRMERSTAALFQNSVQIGGSSENLTGVEAKEQVVSDRQRTVDNLEKKVNRIEEKVYNLDFDAENREKDPPKDVDWQRILGDNPEGARSLFAPFGQEGQEDVSGGEERTNEERAEKSDIPLAAQLEELDRAGSALSVGVLAAEETFRSGVVVSPPDTRRTVAYPGISGALERDWSAGSVFDSAVFPTSGAQNWAEQADRVFRRDSRRYDGGFSLY